MVALGGEKNTTYTFIFHVKKRFSHEKVKHKKEGYKNVYNAIMATSNDASGGGRGVFRADFTP